MTHTAIIPLLKHLQRAAKKLGKQPMSEQIVLDYGRDPFLVLISCLLSLRARDAVTYPISKKLFEKVRTPQELLAMPKAELEAVIKPIGTYRRKAQILQEVAADLINRFDSKVPSDEDDLLSIKGVGRKTANLVRSVAFGIPAICVDVHVHRIANRLGWVHTKTPEQTELALRKIIPKKWWSEVNRLFVLWGQYHCKPQDASHCARGCPFADLCPLVFGKNLLSYKKGISKYR